MSVQPAFDRSVAAGGYAWWYLDAFSDTDPSCGLAIIGFVGSVFSPYYAWARHRGACDPLDHCALNVAIYGPRRHLWTMTERPRGAVRRAADALQIGRSAMHCSGDKVFVDFDEITAPWPTRLRGRVAVEPEATPTRQFALDAHARHHWWPIAPRVRVRVDLQQPDWHWRGTGYFDCNWGDEPLEAGFRHWEWSRAHLDDGATAIAYQAASRDAGHPAATLSLQIDRKGRIDACEPTPGIALKRSAWGLSRRAHGDVEGGARLLRSLEDGPFYARSLVGTRVLGRDAVAVHESLSLDRFAATWVRCLLPFRMPRRRQPQPR
ncbi:MAG TPA: carotenoid 1,2-hydratase [Burkholderiaceae bacterium]|nr:carotenoid 1,2-hydratase [Burkholderiaceae bacterium]